MSSENWIVQLGVRPDQMSPIDPPSDHPNDENEDRIFASIYAMTLAESLSPHSIDPYILEHIQMEKEYSQQDDLTLIWSDEVSLTICFLASLAHCGDYSQDHLFQRYFQWWMNGYMCPTGLCFTPHVHLKKSIDLFGEIQACQALGIEVDLAKKTSMLIPTPSSLLRISPIAYFYHLHSSSKRREIIEDCVGRMFGKQTPIDILIEYIELLVNALNGLSKDEILRKIQLKSNPTNVINERFFQLISILSNDQNNIEQGIQLALENHQHRKEECKYLNPYDSDQTILLTLYLQIAGAIYHSIPQKFQEKIYAKKTIQCLIKWIIYQKYQNLRAI